MGVEKSAEKPGAIGGKVEEEMFWFDWKQFIYLEKETRQFISRPKIAYKTTKISSPTVLD